MIPKYGLNHQEKGMQFRPRSIYRIKTKVNSDPDTHSTYLGSGLYIRGTYNARGNALGYYCNN